MHTNHTNHTNHNNHNHNNHTNHRICITFNQPSHVPLYSAPQDKPDLDVLPKTKDFKVPTAFKEVIEGTEYLNLQKHSMSLPFSRKFMIARITHAPSFPNKIYFRGIIQHRQPRDLYYRAITSEVHDFLHEGEVYLLKFSEGEMTMIEGACFLDLPEETLIDIANRVAHPILLSMN